VKTLFRNRGFRPLELLLETKAYKSKGITYFRIHLPKRVSNALGLREGDKVLIEFKEIRRPDLRKVELNQTLLQEAIAE